MKSTLLNRRCQTWRTISLGTGNNPRRDLCADLRQANYSFDGRAWELLNNSAFPESYDGERVVDLVRVNVEELGLDQSPEKTGISDICNRAMDCGLEPCAEVGPQLLLQAMPDEFPGCKIWWKYIDLFIGMKPIDYNGSPSVLYIGNYCGSGYPILTCKSANAIKSWRCYTWIFLRVTP